MTDLVKSLKIGNNSYTIRDKNTYRSLSAAQESALLSTGKYEGEDVENNTIFEAETGVSKKFYDNRTSHMTGSRAYLPVTQKWMTTREVNGRLFVLPRDGNILLTSTDGYTWTSITLPVGYYTENGGDIAYGNGTYFIVNNSSSQIVCCYSSDLVNWTSVTVLAENANVIGVSYANNEFNVYLNRTYYMHSSNLTEWTQTNLVGFSSSAFRYRYLNNKHFAVLGTINSSSVYYSTDGVNWTNTNVGTSGRYYDITYAGGNYILCDANYNTIMKYSSDLSTWSTSYLPQNFRCTCLGYGDGIVVTCGGTYTTSGSSNMAAYSEDEGVTWKSLEMPTDAFWFGSVSYLNDAFYVATTAYADNYVAKIANTVIHDRSLTPLSYSKSEVDTALAGKIGEDSIGNGLSFEEGSLSIVQASNPVWEQPQVNEPGTMGVSDIAVTESGYYTYTGYDLRAYQCFNDGAVLGKDHWQKNVVSTSTYEWVSWYTKTPVNIKSIVVRNNEGAFSPSNYILEGSNDNSSWTTITSGTNTNVTNFEEWTISSQNNSDYYNYYRLKVLPRTSEAVMIGKLFITGYEYTGTGTVAKATNTLYGLVKPDGTSITVDDGVLSATGGTTYTAGTGIDITGGIISNTGLVNTATGNNSLTILGTPTTKAESVNIGKNSNLESGGNRNVAIGYNSVVQTGAAYATAMGWYAWTQHDGSIALGAGCKTGKINSFYVAVGGFNSHSYMMMDSSGHIPVERYYPMTGANGTNAGTLGAVPAPAATDNNKFLRGDGTWAEAGSSLTAGSNITIDNGIISSKDTTYMAGTGIELKTSKAYTVVGSPTIVDGVASNFSSSNYLTRSLPWDHTKAWELVVPFMDKDLAVDSTSGVLHFTKSTDSSNYGFRLQTSISSLGARAYFRVYDNTNTMIGQAILDGELQSNVQYYIKITYSPTEGYSLSVSTNETDWTTIGTIASTTPMNSGANKLWMGVRSDQSYPLTNGAIDLKKMYLKAEGSPIWTPAGTIINNTGLVNNSESVPAALSVGPAAEAANAGALAVGWGSYSSGEAATAIGANSQAYADYSVAIGPGALSDAVGAIQLGAGENTTADSLQFGVYPLFDGSGNLYKERIKSIIEPVQSLPATPVEGKIYLILGA